MDSEQIRDEYKKDLCGQELWSEMNVVNVHSFSADTKANSIKRGAWSTVSNSGSDN